MIKPYSNNVQMFTDDFSENFYKNIKWGELCSKQEQYFH